MMAPALLSPWSVDDLPASIARRIEVHPAAGCWIVGGYHDPDGYARIGGRGAHRVIWEILEGPVKPGLVLDHREDWGCVAKACGWPAHLLEVTQRVNSTRPGAGGVAAANIVKTHCSACRMPYDKANTYVWNGRRDCRACIRRRVREYKARLRLAHTSPGVAQTSSRETPAAIRRAA